MIEPYDEMRDDANTEAWELCGACREPVRRDDPCCPNAVRLPTAATMQARADRVNAKSAADFAKWQAARRDLSRVTCKACAFAVRGGAPWQFVEGPYGGELHAAREGSGETRGMQGYDAACGHSWHQYADSSD